MRRGSQRSLLHTGGCWPWRRAAEGQAGKAGQDSVVRLKGGREGKERGMEGGSSIARQVKMEGAENR